MPQAFAPHKKRTGPESANCRPRDAQDEDDTQVQMYVDRILSCSFRLCGKRWSDLP